jgi:hypothetical protein
MAKIIAVLSLIVGYLLPWGRQNPGEAMSGLGLLLLPPTTPLGHGGEFVMLAAVAPLFIVGFYIAASEKWRTGAAIAGIISASILFIFACVPERHYFFGSLPNGTMVLFFGLGLSSLLELFQNVRAQLVREDTELSRGNHRH